MGKEDAGYWAHIDELDVSGEGASAQEAFAAAVRAARDWLVYLKEENPDLSEELAAHRHHLELLDAPLFSWFKSFQTSE